MKYMKDFNMGGWNKPEKTFGSRHDAFKSQYSKIKK